MSNLVEYILSLKDEMSPKIDGAKGHVNDLDKTIKDLGKTILEVFALKKIKDFGLDILHTTAEFEGFTNVIKYASVDAKDGQANIDYLGDSIKRLHLPMKQAYEQFSELEGGLYGTGIEGNKLRAVFEGVATASTVLHMSQDQFSRTGYAIKEIGELGTLQTRQMRMLAMALPGSMNLAAEALGFTPKRLHEAMRDGEITAAKFLPAFAAKLKEHFESGLPNATKSLQSGMNDLDTAIDQLKTHLGDDLKPVFIDLMHTMVETIETLKGVWDWMVRNKDTILPLVKTVAELWLAWKGAIILNSVITGVSALIPVLTGAATAVGGFQTAVVAALGPVGLLVSALGTLIFAYNDTLEAAERMKANTDKNLKEQAEQEISGVETMIAALEAKGVSKTDASRRIIKNQVAMLVEELDKGQKEIDRITNENNESDAAGMVLGVHSVQDSGVLDNLKSQNAIQRAQLNAVLKLRNSGSSANTTSKHDNEVSQAKTKATGQKIVNIHIAIAGGLIHGDFKIITNKLAEGMGKAKDMVAQALTSAINDSQIIGEY